MPPNLAREEKKLFDLVDSMKGRKVVCVDLDGCLANFDGWKGFFSIGKPNKRIVFMIRNLKKMGCEIIVHSCRVTTADHKLFHPSVKNLKNWLKKNRVPFDEIWTKVGKPFGHVYIDDNSFNVNCNSCMKNLHPKLFK